MSDFSEFLYTLRKEKGITQAELAEKLGVTNKAVSKWETGESMPETAQLLPISQIFGVSVDELLKGERSEVMPDNTPQNKEYRADEKERIEDNLFTRGDDDEKTLLGKIQGAVCSAVVFAGVLTYLLLGIIKDFWHPYWAIIPACAFLSGIIGCVFDIFNKDKCAEKIAKGENPYSGAICGILMLTCLTVYILLGALLGLWHPLWVIFVAGGFACAIIAMVVEIISHKRK